MRPPLSAGSARLSRASLACRPVASAARYRVRRRREGRGWADRTGRVESRAGRRINSAYRARGYRRTARHGRSRSRPTSGNGRPSWTIERADSISSVSCAMPEPRQRCQSRPSPDCWHSRRIARLDLSAHTTFPAYRPLLSETKINENFRCERDRSADCAIPRVSRLIASSRSRTNFVLQIADGRGAIIRPGSSALARLRRRRTSGAGRGHRRRGVASLPRSTPLAYRARCTQQISARILSRAAH